MKNAKTKKEEDIVGKNRIKKRRKDKNRKTRTFKLGKENQGELK